MLTFIEWIKLNEGLQIVHIDPEEDWEQADVAYQIAQMVGIRPNRMKEPTIIALNDKGDVIGAAFTSWSDDDDASQAAGEPVGLWDFDVVVHPQWQGYEMVGMKLIRQAEEEKANMEAMYGQNAYTRLWVVNPRLAKILQHPKYGYSADGEYGDGSAHLTKY